MAKIVLADVLSGYSLTSINDNFSKIEDAINNEVLFRNNPSGESNTLSVDIDVNGHKLYNLAAPTGDSHAARLKDVKNAIAGLSGQAANLISFSPTAYISADNIQGAVEQVSTYLPTGPGGLTRSVVGKFQDLSVSLADYGGSLALADNTTALQLAVNSGKSVYIPDGYWRISYSVSLPNHTYIWGPGSIQRTTVGPIFTATTKYDIVIQCGLKGDVNSWALSFKNCQRIRVTFNKCEESMLLQTDSLTSLYSTTTTSNMSSDVVVYGFDGVCTQSPNAVSQQFVRLLYTRNFSVGNNTASGYRDFCLCWGGDFSTDGAAENERKCYTGLVFNNRASVLAAGIWTGMARDVRITGNKLTGNAFAEGLDAEGSIDITFEGNDAYNFADGMTVFGLNRSIKFWNNNITATANAFRNANSTFYPDYGLIEMDGNTYRSISGTCLNWITGAAGRIRLTNNRFENTVLTLTDVAVADVVMLDNELYFDYAPAGPWFVRLGGIANGYTVQPKKSQMVIKRNLIEWRGADISGKRALGLTSSAIPHFIDIQENTFVGIDEQISYEGSTGPMSVLVKRNTFDTDATYPAVLHGSSDGLTVIWQDNDRSDGLDAYGINTSAAITASYFSTGSRIWSNNPTNGNTPGWIKRTGVFGPMASIG